MGIEVVELKERDGALQSARVLSSASEKSHLLRPACAYDISCSVLNTTASTSSPFMSIIMRAASRDSPIPR